MAAQKRKPKGFLNPTIVRAISFYVIVICIAASVFVSIMAVWGYGDENVIWKMISTFAIIGIGIAVFAYVNGVFGVEEE